MLWSHHLRLLLAVGLSIRSGASVSVIGPKADLQIVNAQIAPDGFSRATVLAGGVFPGPVISGKKGEKFEINVIDELTDRTMLRATSIHWHGLFVSDAAWVDGASSATQCPISPGHSFKYELPNTSQAGTFWYHSHLSAQICDGLRGPLVIYDPDDPHSSLYDIDDGSSHDHPAVSSQANSTLINGLGRYKGGPNSPLAVIHVEQGKRYRFRLISMSCDPHFNFSIDQHNIKIIEVDGENHQPLVVDSLQILAGQRYSFVLHADQPADNYWIRANPDFPGIPGFDGGINQAILRYREAPESEPQPRNSSTSNLLKETDLQPLENPEAPGEPHIDGADISLNLAIGFNRATGLFNISGVPFVPPTVPVLLQILSGAASAQSLLPEGSVYELPKNKTIQISLPAGDSHPMHLHGHTFSVIRSAGSQVYNYVNPVRRVSTGVSTDNVTIRFKTDNAGPWFLHCHINPHFEHGLAIVFAEDIPKIRTLAVPDAWKELCPIYDAERKDSDY
ncbi:laccase [Marasmius fiardii PR-910]|nr:laccase [Marasmius fiardii PR-910]